MMKRFLKTFMAFALILSMVLPVLTPVASAAGQSGSGLKDYHSMTMEQIFASKEDLTWVVTGDSITHNEKFTTGMNSYTEWFEKYLYQTGRGDDVVINSAWGGAVIKDFLYYEESGKRDPGLGIEQLVTKYNPDIVTIKIGMNNRGTDDATFIKHYNKALDAIYAEGKKNGKIPKIILISSTPLAGESLSNQEQTDLDSVWRHQRNVQKIAQERGLIFVDLQTAFTTAALEMGPEEYRAKFFSDGSDGGIHPNAAGQYFMFQTLSKALGIYDESMPIFCLDYDDLLYVSLWDDKTGSLDLSFKPEVSLNSAADKAQMNAAMPSAPSGSNLLSYIDFTDANGYFDGTGSHTVEMTDPSLGAGVLTLAEAKAMGKTFTVVFRAKLATPSKPNQSILFLSNSGYSNWNNALTLSAPGANNEVYYQMRIGSTGKVSGGGRIALSGSANAVDGDWHTIAVVQTETELQYYVDGQLGWKGSYALGAKIGDLFASASTVNCQIGSYGAAAAGYDLHANFDYWQLYSGALSASQIKALSGNASGADADSTWLGAYGLNNLWAVAGGDQMSGYQGMYVHRSLFHLFECQIRSTGNQPQYYRDIRLMNLSAPGYTISDMAEQLAKKQFDVLFLLPEVSHVYADGYVHSAQQVADYKASVQKLLNQYKDKIRILWTPLASGDATINGYLNDYADAIREIVAGDSSILFWDANGFMNTNMKKNTSLQTNWFDGEMYLTPLGATDLCRGFFTHVIENGVPLQAGIDTVLREITDHNLRQTSDNRHFKHTVIRDNLPAAVAVNGTKISMDLTAMVNAGYDLSDVKFVLIPSVGFSDHSDLLVPITNVTKNGNVYTFEAPCSNPVIAIYADGYRFRDMEVKVTTSATIPQKTVTTTDLTGLKVLGAKDFGFNAATTSYEVKLHQYQSYVQIVGTAGEGQTITINGEAVLSGERSKLIEVGEGTTVTVKANGKTYTLKLTRPEYPDIIITEVMQDTTGEKYDMLEIYNASGRDLDLKDYSIGFKKDYAYTHVTDSDNKYPYYFLGNTTNFNSTNGGAATQTGINPITKYSTYEPGYDAAREPASIPFPAGSTMVLWVRKSGTNNLTYQDLVKDFTAMADYGNYNYKVHSVNGVPVIPGAEQVVMAEVPKGVASAGLSMWTDYQYGYLENHGDSISGTNNARTWLFILDKNAKRHYFTGITEAGDDIFSAAMMSRVNTSVNLSTVLYYDTERGMSLVEEPGKLLGKPVTGYTSSQSGYMNLTTFGAIEYWQKPYDLGDAAAPTAAYTISGGKLTLTLKDDTDVRYFQLNLDVDNDGVFETTITKDLVLESSAASATGTPAVTKEYVYTYDLGSYADAECYGYVLDGNNNKGAFGAYGDLTVSLGGDETAAETDSIQVQIQLNKGDAAIALDKTYDVVDAQGNVLGTISGNKLTGTVKLTNGQKLFVKGLPAGTAYTLTFEVPEGFKAIETISGKVAEGIAPDVVLKLVAEESEDDPIVNPGDGSGNGGGTTDPSDPTDPSQPGTDPTDPSKPGGSGSNKPTDPSQPGEPEQPAGESYILWWSLLGVTIAIGAAIIGVILVIAAKARKKK